jgi:hypothetical protein
MRTLPTDETALALHLTPGQLGRESTPVIPLDFVHGDQTPLWHSYRLSRYSASSFSSKLAGYGVDTFRLKEAESIDSG